jgi:hypothetical protein
MTIAGRPQIDTQKFGIITHLGAPQLRYPECRLNVDKFEWLEQHLGFILTAEPAATGQYQRGRSQRRDPKLEIHSVSPSSAAVAATDSGRSTSFIWINARSITEVDQRLE